METSCAGKRAMDDEKQEFDTILGTLRCARKSSSVQIHTHSLANWGSSNERKNKSKNEIADAENVTKNAGDLPWPISYSRNKQVTDSFIVYLLLFLGWNEVIVQNISFPTV